MFQVPQPQVLVKIYLSSCVRDLRAKSATFYKFMN